MLLIFFVATFGMNFQVTTALMAREVFHTGAGAFGIASAVFASGALAGALLAARKRRPGAGLLVVTAVASVARDDHRADAGILGVPRAARADRPGAVDVQHRGEFRDPAGTTPRCAAA